jgi:signal transduction histidine kinase
MAIYFRKRSTIRIPLTLSVSLMALNVTLMVCWILLLVEHAQWTALTVGVVTFTLILAGLSIWLVLTIKEVRLNNRQANFVDSVTHELKSPIAALQLYLETLRMRSLDDSRREEFHAVMAAELQRLDQLINQLLEVGRLDALGEQEEPEDVLLEPLLRKAAESACVKYQRDPAAVFTLDVPAVTLHASRIVLELIVANLVDNAVKYGGDPPEVRVQAVPDSSTRVRLRITNNGAGIPHEDRKKVFRIFYRGGSELERRRTGTGLGLYIVHTLVKKLKGRVSVQSRPDRHAGCTIEVELPGRVALSAPGSVAEASASAVPCATAVSAVPAGNTKQPARSSAPREAPA